MLVYVLISEGHLRCLSLSMLHVCYFLWRVLVYWVNSDLVRFMCISYNQQMFHI